MVSVTLWIFLIVFHVKAVTNIDICFGHAPLEQEEEEKFEEHVKQSVDSRDWTARELSFDGVLCVQNGLFHAEVVALLCSFGDVLPAVGAFNELMDVLARYLVNLRDGNFKLFYQFLGVWLGKVGNSRRQHFWYSAYVCTDAYQSARCRF